MGQSREYVTPDGVHHMEVPIATQERTDQILDLLAESSLDERAAILSEISDTTYLYLLPEALASRTHTADDFAKHQQAVLDTEQYLKETSNPLAVQLEPAFEELNNALNSSAGSMEFQKQQLEDQGFKSISETVKSYFDTMETKVESVLSKYFNVRAIEPEPAQEQEFVPFAEALKETFSFDFGPKR